MPTLKETVNEQTKELIAIGASVAAHCQPCLTYHVNKARGLGVEADAIRAAIEVGHQVEKGSMSAMREFSKGLTGAGCEEAQAAAGGKTCCG
ncbi:MAG: carboxymuconolactone decarboxylase family protein [Lentisphaerota bacterium]